MNKKLNNINGYILAGGKSSRMGKDKGMIIYNGKAIIEYIIEQLKPLVNKLVIVSNNFEYEKFGVEVINDLLKDIGPAGGIYTALNHTKEELNFIVSCDMPQINKEAIAFIIKNSTNSQITVPEKGGEIEPLFGVYTKDCLTKWAECIKQREIKLKEMITNFKLNIINTDDNILFNDNFFMNINTNKDLNNAISLIKNGN